MAAFNDNPSINFERREASDSDRLTESHEAFKGTQSYSLREGEDE